MCFFKFWFCGGLGLCTPATPPWMCPFFQRLCKRPKLEKVQHIMNAALRRCVQCLEYDPSDWNLPSHQCEGQTFFTESPAKLSISRIKAQPTK